MKEFEVQFSGLVNVAAENLEDAVKIFYAIQENIKTIIPNIAIGPNQFHTQDQDTPNVVHGTCEVCNRPLFNEDEYDIDNEGIIWHKEDCTN